MPTFLYQGRTCYFEEFGVGTPLVFLHGNTASSAMFRELCASFAQYYKVVLIDFLGHGRSQRVARFAADLWVDEARQAIAFLEQRGYSGVNLIGSSGGALVAINAALERPDLVNKVIADSFEGETPLPQVIKTIKAERETSKSDPQSRAFYASMHGDDWESVVDCDTAAILEHARTVGRFFSRPLREMRRDILLTGSEQDEFVGPGFFEKIYSGLIRKMGRGEMALFQRGGHPAALSNGPEFCKLALNFFDG